MTISVSEKPAATIFGIAKGSSNTYLLDYMVSHLRRSLSEESPPDNLESYMSNNIAIKNRVSLLGT
jgi:hypothetical protein